MCTRSLYFSFVHLSTLAHAPNFTIPNERIHVIYKMLFSLISFSLFMYYPYCIVLMIHSFTPTTKKCYTLDSSFSFQISETILKRSDFWNNTQPGAFYTHAMFDPKSIFESEVYGYKSCKPGRLNMLWKLSDPETRRWCVQQAARKAILKKVAQLAQCGSPHTSLCLQNPPFTPNVFSGKYPTIVPDPATAVPSIRSRLSGSQAEANEARRHQLKNHLRRHGLSHHWSRRQQLEALAVRAYAYVGLAISESRGDKDATTSSCTKKRKREDNDDDEVVTRPLKVSRN